MDPKKPLSKAAAEMSAKFTAAEAYAQASWSNLALVTYLQGLHSYVCSRIGHGSAIEKRLARITQDARTVRVGPSLNALVDDLRALRVRAVEEQNSVTETATDPQ